MTTEAAPRAVVLTRVRLGTEDLDARLALNPLEAAAAIRDAALHGSPAAQLVLGQILLDGRGVKRDPAQALTWFERAAEGGDVVARNMVGRCHERGWGAPQDYLQAARHFEDAARRGHVWAKVNLAQILMRLGDPADRPRAFELFRQAAAAGSLKAVNSLARFLEEGWTGPPDPAAAAALYRTAAERGDHWAQFNLATVLARSGQLEDAGRWIGRAIARSDNGFRRRIAPLLLAHPNAGLRAYGLDALERCAASDDAEGQMALADALQSGVTGPPDRRRIRGLVERAAALGHSKARARAGPAGALRRLISARSRPGRAAPPSPSTR